MGLYLWAEDLVLLYVDPLGDDDEVCAVQWGGRGYRCNRAPGHQGPHVATTTEEHSTMYDGGMAGCRVVAAWEDEG